MTELSEKEKQYINNESIKAVIHVCRLKGVDFMKLSEQTRKLLIDVFIAGAGLAIQVLSKEEKNEH